MVLSEKISRISPLARATAIVGMVAALVTGITFAATSEATLTGNSITLAAETAELQLWDGDSFESTAPGFSFSGLVPGEPSEPFNFYFKNNGNVPLHVAVGLGAGGVPDFTGLSFTADDVTLTFEGACADPPLVRTLAELDDLTSDNLPCNPLEEDAQGVVGEDDTNEANYKVTVEIDESVDLGETEETVPDFDLVFTGDTELPEIVEE
jgi:hypothetical protein